MNENNSIYSKKLIALILTVGLVLGTVIGFGLDSFWSVKPVASHVAYATENQALVNTGGNVSPVVPIAKKVLPAIVAIKVKANVTGFFGSEFEQQGTGSGIIIDDQGHIATNNHVVENAQDISVVLKDGKELPAELVGRDPVTDLAVIQVKEKNLPYAELGDSSKLEVGELAVAIGSPMGTEYAGSVTAGIISGLNRKVSLGNKSMTLIQTDAAINPGNSGGALVNSAGQVIGINTLKLVEAKVEGMGFAIPINEAKPIISELISHKKIVRPFLGIQGITVTQEDAKIYGIPQGVYIHDVVTLSGADRAGLKKGDIITKIDGQKILAVEDIVSVIGKHKVGDVVKVEIFDKFDRTSVVSVKLTENTQPE